MQYLWLVVDATPYAEGIVLGTVLLAMAGRATAAVAPQRARMAASWGLLLGFLLMAAAQLVWLATAADVARLFERLIHQSAWMRASALRFFLAHSLLALTVLSGPAFAAGLLFPILCSSGAAGCPAVAQGVGRLTAWNYMGSAAGATVSALVMLPWLGVTGSLVVLTAAILLVAGGCVLPQLGSRRWRLLAYAAQGLLAALTCWLAVAADATFRTAAAGPHTKVLFHHEDGSGIVEVYEDQATGHRTLLTSRLRQEGGDGPDALHVQRLQGALPVLLHPAPRRVLVVGLGTGISLAANLRPEVEHLTCVELSAGVIRAAAFFAHAHDGIVSHPRLTLVQQDGRNFLKLTRERYDLIVQDLFFPYRSGVGHLYTLEHFRRLRARLTPGGRAAQWIALNQVALPELRSLVRTFAEVFPETSLWLTGGYLLLYGGAEPLTIDWESFQRRFQARPPTAQTDPADLLGMFVAAGERVRQWAAIAPLNTDDRPLIEYRAAWAFAALNTVALAVDNLQALLPLHRPVAELIPGLPMPARQQLDRVHTAVQHLWQGIVARVGGDLDRARLHYERAQAFNPVNYQARSFLVQDFAARGRQRLLAGQAEEAATFLRRALALTPRHTQARYDLALAAVMRGDDAEAVEHFRQLLEEQAPLPHLRFNLGVSLYRLGRYAAAEFSRVVAAEPSSVPAQFNLANSLARAGRYEEAVHWYQRTLALDPGHRLAQQNLRALQVWMAERTRRRD
jgi:spermidine synthase/tetratricopeptide (TPR) repeat protein